LHVNFLKYIQSVSNGLKSEACGYITEKKIVFLKNTSKYNKITFLADTSSLLKDFRAIRYIFHSHPEGTAELSEADFSVAQEIKCPTIVYSVQEKQFSIYNPKNTSLIYFSI
jgi:proteasome lid subunit RPN8/RPN11